VSAPDATELGFWRVVEREPSRMAIIGPDDTAITFAELAEMSDAAARGLHALGLRQGDVACAVLPNVASFFVVYLAAMRTGLYFTPVNSHLAPPEVAHVIADSEASAVVVHADLAEVARSGLDAAGVAESSRFADPGAPGFRDFDDLLRLGRSQMSTMPDPTPGTVMMYTSGTTGKPKGVRRPLPSGDPTDHFGQAAHVYCRGFGMPIEDGVHLVCGPLYHAGPSSSSTSALHAGNTLVLMDRWSPEGCLRLIERHGVTSTQMVPTMFHRLLALPEDVRDRYDVSSIKSIMHTGAPCPVETKQRLMEWLGPVVFETYGGTESVATIATPRRWLAKPGTVGKPIQGVVLHVLDDEGNELGPGEVGAIYIESDRSRETEYYKDPEKTRSMRRGGLVSLGDVGYVDEDGDLFLCDRKVDMVISGGVNIYPAEIEAVLMSAPEVADVAVIGIPDEEWGEQVAAIVELSSGFEPSSSVEDSLRAYCEGKLARFKHPRRFEFVEQLPRQPNGKVEKRRLREPYWRNHERSI
jgi:long-chain acyl-CoA synthetase